LLHPRLLHPALLPSSCVHLTKRSHPPHPINTALPAASEILIHTHSFSPPPHPHHHRINHDSFKLTPPLLLPHTTVIADMSTSTEQPTGSFINLTTSDNQPLKVDRKVAERSILIKNLLEDLGGDNDEAIPIPNVCLASTHSSSRALLTRHRSTRPS